MKEIPLTKGKVAIVDDEDYEEITKYKWCVQRRSDRKHYRAVRRTNEDRYVYMHRVIMDAKESQEVDHINGDGLDNRRANLRLCNHKENGANMHKHKPHSSQYKGVDWKDANQKWRARAGALYLGLFDSEEDAARAYDAKAIELFGEFANLNFSENNEEAYEKN